MRKVQAHLAVTNSLVPDDLEVLGRKTSLPDLPSYLRDGIMVCGRCH
jgi:hypothetical protein